MAYSPTGSSDLFLILGCMTSNFLYLSLSTLNSSSLWRTDTIVFAKLVKPPIKPPLKCVSNKQAPPPPGGGLIEDLRNLFTKALLTFPPVESDLK